MMRITCLLTLLWLGVAQAHTVPNLVVEAEFLADGAYTLKVNFDPRLVISEKPTTLPPVTAAWWLDQTAEQQIKSRLDAKAYLLRAIVLLFSGAALPEPAWDIQPMDGTNSMPLAKETTEVHLLATLKGQLPTAAENFSIKLEPAANAALVLLSSVNGAAERRPQVIFTGETSRPRAVR
jgi:hypothetical protein